MDKDLVTAYAHGNLHEALLAQLFVRSIRGQMLAYTTEGGGLSTEQVLAQIRQDVLGYLQAAQYSQGDLSVEQMRQEAYRLADNFFEIVKDMLGPDSIQ